jgi:hypothetical protein
VAKKYSKYEFRIIKTSEDDKFFYYKIEPVEIKVGEVEK